MTEYRYQGEKLPSDERKRRMQTQRHGMREQPPMARVLNFDEVNLGYTEEAAMAEARRCLRCPTAPCVGGCPVHVKVPEFLDAVADGDFMEAARIVMEDNALPAVTGRVCPQEVQCEGPCTQGKAGQGPVGIGYLERFVADWERTSEQTCCFDIDEPSGHRVAIVGSGPGGLSAAADAARAGHEVHVYEALHRPGGVLVYGIPEFRLPNDIITYEIQRLQDMGVSIHSNHAIGRIYTVDELLDEKGYDAVYLGIGAGLPWFMRIEGENLNGVYSANEYLTRTNLMQAYRFPETDTPIVRGRSVAVVGGGNVAMDAVRSALRLGASNAYLIYRRSREQMPARDEEIKHAEEEGVQFRLLNNPVRYIGDEHGWVQQVECIEMELGEPDRSGRPRPVPIEGSEFRLDVDVVVVAIGTGANPLLIETTHGLETTDRGYIQVDDRLRTTKPGVFAGGDIVRGGATVILAMGDGRTAAASINEWLESGDWPADAE